MVNARLRNGAFLMMLHGIFTVKRTQYFSKKRRLIAGHRKNIDAYKINGRLVAKLPELNESIAMDDGEICRYN